MHNKRADLTLNSARPATAAQKSRPSTAATATRRLANATTQNFIAAAASPKKPIIDQKSTVRILVNKTAQKIGVTPSSATPARRSTAPVTIRATPTRLTPSPTLEDDPVANYRSPISSSSRTSDDSFSNSSSRSSGSRSHQRPLAAPTVDSPRPTAVRTTMAPKKTPTAIKVKLPGTEGPRMPAGTTKVRASVSVAAPAAEAVSCKNCRNRSPMIDPVAMEIQANDKALRKIMDLEISNSSLLAVNSSLENTIRQHVRAAANSASETARLSAELTAPRENWHKSPADQHVDAIIISSSIESEGVEEETSSGSISYSRSCAMIQQMIDDGRAAAEYIAPVHAPLPQPAKEQPKHDIDIETQARQALARRESHGALARAAGALRKRQSRSPPPPQLVSPIAYVNTVPVVNKVSTRRATRTNSGSDLSNGSSSASSSSRRSAANLNPAANRQAAAAALASSPPAGGDAVRRRGSVVMRPFIDSAAHYLDDPYVILDQPPPVVAVQCIGTSGLARPYVPPPPSYPYAKVNRDDMSSLLSS
ncbi:hypothetical protein HDU88_000856 [Geranomyces variabilis]|nr:hypothetical protein HDU88_000856 [Geranomyces variabilis]